MLKRKNAVFLAALISLPALAQNLNAPAAYCLTSYKSGETTLLGNTCFFPISVEALNFHNQLIEHLLKPSELKQIESIQFSATCFAGHRSDVPVRNENKAILLAQRYKCIPK